ncbi:metallophosphoesterase [Megasphaera sp. UPII 135-E]|uniref:metallophosphoesterase n=1 Tax=Megasphaera sp. UPII 135-E TaxID=1000569 RepID=UPI00021A3ACE|nr:metallophosphoesterase [Megasphaera sp. UPII 135-E]EGS34144.1 Ser/Thr phosphatase family protein [Megasphaera sp. UPII 135-E]MUP48499.1 serine/threonine protein phosphatase [Veillonellaceae bacterium M2-8]MUP58441.1 serine/threonine protein phosphatase [Veillonellaceae bacterium M2-4]
MRLFAIGDLHLSGHPPKKPMEIFGSRWKNHWLRIQEDWKNRVTEKDTVLIAGDTSWAMRLQEAQEDLDEIRALPGHKIIIRGNHDYWWESAGKLNRLDAGNRMQYLYGTTIVTHDGRFAICGTHGWLCPNDKHFHPEKDAKPYRRELLRVERTLQEAATLNCLCTILLLHYPPVHDLFHPSGFTELLKKYHVPLCIFGHLHGLTPHSIFPRKYDETLLHLVSADYRECKLLEIKINEKGVPYESDC